MNYSVILKHTDNSISYLSVRDRTEWKVRTARKHLKDVTAKILSGEWAHIQYAALTQA